MDLDGLMEWIQAHVWWPHGEMIRREGDGWVVSTGGWSGNEEVIDAMAKNTMWWANFWRRVERGGHYAFSRQASDLDPGKVIE